MEFGGFWVRFVAYIIDVILLYIVQIVVAIAFGVSATAGFGTGETNADPLSGTNLAVTAIVLIINIAYFVAMESSAKQGTVGKIAMGLVVTDLNGERISALRALGRYFAKFISAIILLIGFIMVGFTQRKQGLHDMIAGTLVYKARSPELVRNSAAVFE